MRNETRQKIPGIGSVFLPRFTRNSKDGKPYQSKTWWICYQVDGKEKRESSQSKSAELAIRLLYERVTRKPSSTSDTRTVQEYTENWLKLHSSNLKASTFAEYEASLKKHIFSCSIATKRLNEVSRADTKQLIATLKAKALSVSTIRNAIAPLRASLFEAVDDGLISSNPFARTGKYNKGSKDAIKKKIDPLTRAEVKLFLSTVLEKRPHWYPIFLCAVRTGLRQGELLALKCSDIDFNS